MNRELLQQGATEWTEDAIRSRTKELINVILQVWPVPPGYRSNLAPETTRVRKRVSLADLIAAGVLHAGMSLFPRRQKHSAHVATLLADGKVEVDGVAYSSPSDAASKIAGHNRNGWSFFAIDQASGRSLRAIRRDHVNALSVDVEDDEIDETEEDDEVVDMV